MKLLIMLFFLIPTWCFAQNYTVERPEQNVYFDPYKAVYFKDYNNYENVKSITIITKDKRKKFEPDTLIVKEYNEKGLLSNNIRYQNNRRKSSTLTSYNDQGNVVNWLAIYPKSSTQTFYFYNKNQQIVRTRQVSIRNIRGKIDTTELNEKLFEYEGNRLMKITSQSGENGTPLIEMYEYKESGLYRKSGGYTVEEFAYNDSGTVEISREYMQRFEPKMLMTAKRFVYDSENRLIQDSVVTSTNRTKGQFKMTDYTYDETGKLATMNIKFGDLYRNVTFEYVDDKIKSATVKTNGTSAYLHFWVLSWIYEAYLPNAIYKEVFDYDEFGNRTSKRIYVNEELYIETMSVIEYRR